MVLCIVAFFVFAILSIFSAKYRPLAKEAFKCVFHTITLKPCDTGLDERIKSQFVYTIFNVSPAAAKFVNRYFAPLSLLFVLLSLASLGYVVYGVYNFYNYGNCDGPNAANSCILNDLTGDYGRFSSPRDLITPTSLRGITVGNAGANISIIEFGCFTCPYTKKAEPLVKQLLQRYNNSIFYVFKPFPLPNHNNSFDAAKAVLCASRQGKHWNFRDLIFAQQEVCSATGQMAIKELAVDAGLNVSEFNRCFDNNESVNELNEYIQEGKDAHIYATPTFFVNSKPLIGPKSVEEIEQLMK